MSIEANDISLCPYLDGHLTAYTLKKLKTSLIRFAYNSNFCFEIWCTTNADYLLLTYLVSGSIQQTDYSTKLFKHDQNVL